MSDTLYSHLKDIVKFKVHLFDSMNMTQLKEHFLQQTKYSATGKKCCGLVWRYGTHKKYAVEGLNIGTVKKELPLQRP